MAGEPPPPQAGKVSVTCPHCRAEQLESAFAKTTICRKCHQYFPVAGAGAEPSPKESHWLLARVSAIVSRPTTRTIQCPECAQSLDISTAAKSSICSHCSAYIDLRDFKISTNFSRNIQTLGDVTITSKGDVVCATVACTDAYVQGKLRGMLVCAGTAHLKLKGKFLGAIDCNHLVIEKGAQVELVRPARAKTAEILGRLSARIAVDGMLTVRKTGCVEGTIYTKGVTVDKGGLFNCELFVGKHEHEQGELLGEPDPGLFGDSLAFEQA